MKFISTFSGILGAFCVSGMVLATPFEECPSSAYLVQGSSARVYGVNLATGYYQLLSEDLGVSGKVNAIGFNVHDRYIYGYSSELKTLVKMNSQFQATAVNVTNAPNTNFYVGDVSLNENTYYAYKPGSDFGLYSLNLNPEAPNAFEYQKVISGADLNISIYDFAFHPTNSQLYAVDRNGRLITIDPDLGTYEVISNVGETGTFGAVYFDSSEYFYISRNSDGHIYRINLNDASPIAEFFAFGPSSSNNDGARCASANIISDTDSVDFGNAPASYGSDIEGNGARHEVSDNLYLGSGWGGEDDGMDFVTTVEPGLSSIVVAKVEGDGFLNAWGDWNQNGEFESSEQFIQDQATTDGDNLIQIDVPVDAVPGETWTRVRYSSQSGIGPNGGVSDGEVEDYQVDVVDAGTSVVHYPSSSGFVTLAYEDNWPEVGDYDMNDVVVGLRTSQYSNESQQTFRYEINGKVLALGAGYHNGFAIQLDGVPTSAIDSVATELFINGTRQSATPLEQNDENDDAIFIISNDFKSALPLPSQCQYYRTEENCASFEQNDELLFSLVITLSQPVDVSVAPKNVLNPFVFATPGIYHGDAFSSPPGRSLEIHLKNKAVSSRFNAAMFGVADDHSDGDITTFSNANGLPWALEIPGLWAHPKEKIDLLKAYPQFEQFVVSGSQESATWYVNDNQISHLIINNSGE